jgi:hypothetical protein
MTKLIDFPHDRANIPEINNTLTNGILIVFPQKISDTYSKA